MGQGRGDGYTVKALARLAGVSVRTLHHYDSLGLLRPERRTAAGYRLYGPAQLLRLQQILFFKELEFPLPEIARLLAGPDFDPAAALREHRKALEERLGRLHRLLATLDRTLDHYSGGPMLNDAEIYAGFPPERREAVRKEARERYGKAAVGRAKGG